MSIGWLKWVFVVGGVLKLYKAKVIPRINIDMITMRMKGLYRLIFCLSIYDLSWEQSLDSIGESPFSLTPATSSILSVKMEPDKAVAAYIDFDEKMFAWDNTQARATKYDAKASASRSWTDSDDLSSDFPKIRPTALWNNIIWAISWAITIFLSENDKFSL